MFNFKIVFILWAITLITYVWYNIYQAWKEIEERIKIDRLNYLP